MDAFNNFVFGVDLDGVVADFYTGLRPIAAEWLGVPEESLTNSFTYGLPEWGLNSPDAYDNLHRFAVSQRDLFRKLNPMHGAPAALRRLSNRKLRIRIITHRLYIKYFHEEAVSQTIEWLENYGIPYWDLCFMKDKAAVGADLYIEDSPTNIKQLRADGHPTIVFVNSTNSNLDGLRATSWGEVEKLVESEHEKWKKKATTHHLSGQ